MRPTNRAILLLAAGFPVALLPAIVSPELWPFWLVALGGTLLLVGLDFLLAIPAKHLHVSPHPPRILYTGDSEEMELEFRGHPRRKTEVEIIVEVSPELERIESRTAVIAGRSKIPIPLRATRRGMAQAHEVWTRWTGPFGLMSRVKKQSLALKIPIVPNVRAVRQAALQIYTQDAEFGQKVDRRRGGGSEFDALREYVPGLDHRAIDWKHSARHRKLVSKEFRTERNHQVVFALDTGHLMSEPLDGIPKLDHAVNASLLLSYMCLRAGDRVSLFSFDSTVRGYSEPSAGVQSFPRLQRQAADLEYRFEETNYTLGMAELSARLRKRSLVVVVTDFVDSISAELMVENLQRLARRHVVLFVALRDPSLDAIVRERPSSLHQIHRSVVADSLVRERDTVIERMRRTGIVCIDTEPAKLGTDLLNHYLEIKRRERI